MKKKPEKIDGVVKSIIKRLDDQSIPTSEAVTAAWDEVVGNKAKLHTKPASLIKKRLTVNVDGSTWLYELTLKKESLVKEMKKRLGEGKIEEIQFRIGDI
ncbi:MAG: DUF721 domain-containing protein [Candidatus Omnitrophica bacterium]|nr:DUF721 domain-containing protein [Candidatus Omnitrophota bacterium]